MEYNKLIGWHDYASHNTTTNNIQLSDSYTRIFDHVLKKHEPRIILELNVDTGKNTQWFADYTNDNTHIYAADMWERNKITFFDNLCSKKNKITPMQMNALTSADFLLHHNIIPNFIFISHARAEDIRKLLLKFPNAIIAGDNYNREIREVAVEHKKSLHVDTNNVWIYDQVQNKYGEQILIGTNATIADDRSLLRAFLNEISI